MMRHDQQTSHVKQLDASIVALRRAQISNSDQAVSAIKKGVDANTRQLIRKVFGSHPAIKQALAATKDS
jgi:hypothetical protein